MGHHDGEGHELSGLVAGVAEHQALVARAARAHAHIDVWTLPGEIDFKLAGVRGEASVRVGVANVVNRLADQSLDVGLGGCRDFPGYVDRVVLNHRLAGHAPPRVFGEDGVQHSVGNLVADFVGVALRHRL